MLLHGGPVVDNRLFFVREVFEGHIGAHAHRAADVRHEGPHQGLPREYRPFVDRLRLVGHERRAVNRSHLARTRADRAGTAAVEGEIFGPGRTKALAANGTDERFVGSDGERRRHVVAVRASMARETRKHEAKTIEELRPGAECASNPRDARPLVKRKCRRYMTNLVDIRGARLRHAPARIGRERLEVPARAFGIKHPERERGLARTRDARHRHDFPERNVDVDVFEVVHPCAAHRDVCRHAFLHSPQELFRSRFYELIEHYRARRSALNGLRIERLQ